MKFVGHILHPDYNHIVYSNEQFEEKLAEYKEIMKSYKEDTGYYSAGWIMLDEDDMYAIPKMTEEEQREKQTHYVKDYINNGGVDNLGRWRYDWLFNFKNTLKEMIESYEEKKIYIRVSPLVMGELDGVNLNIERILTFDIIGIEEHDDDEEFEE